MMANLQRTVLDWQFETIPQEIACQSMIGNVMIKFILIRINTR